MKSMGKIIIFADDLNQWGGIERVTSSIANGLANHGYQIILINIRGGDNPFFKLDPSITIKSLFRKHDRILLRTPFIISRLRRYIIEEKPQILITVEAMLALFSVPATIGLSIRNICWEHLNFKVDLGRRGRRIARKIAARYCDDIVTLTEQDKLLWIRGTKVKAQIHTIPDPCPFPVQINHTPPENSRLVLAIGRLTYQKGFDLLLKAWGKVIKAEPDWLLRVVGSGPDEQYLKQISSQLGISRTVAFVPATSDVQSHYKEAAIYGMSSRFEGFAIVLVEAMAFGVPIVSFDCEAGPAEILTGTGAALVPPENIEELANNILRFIRDPFLRAAISKKEKIRAEEFQIDKIINHWVALLERSNKISNTNINKRLNNEISI
jgi:glycosyltransferase involved in cell wall biosynthesis